MWTCFLGICRKVVCWHAEIEGRDAGTNSAVLRTDPYNECQVSQVSAMTVFKPFILCVCVRGHMCVCGGHICGCIGGQPRELVLSCMWVLGSHWSLKTNVFIHWDILLALDRLKKIHVCYLWGTNVCHGTCVEVRITSGAHSCFTVNSLET